MLKTARLIRVTGASFLNDDDGLITERYFDFWQGEKRYKAGGPCLLFFGQVESDLPQNKYMTLLARGYNVDGEEVTNLRNAGPIQGVISLFLPVKGIGWFILHLNPAPGVVKIELFPSTELCDIPPPLRNFLSFQQSVISRGKEDRPVPNPDMPEALFQIEQGFQVITQNPPGMVI
jgi:hypothetical protein